MTFPEERRVQAPRVWTWRSLSTTSYQVASELVSQTDKNTVTGLTDSREVEDSQCHRLGLRTLAGTGVIYLVCEKIELKLLLYLSRYAVPLRNLANSAYNCTLFFFAYHSYQARADT